MDIITQLIVSFFSTAGIAIIFNVPRKTLFHCGFVGVIGWMIYYLLTEQGLDVVDASFFSSFIIAIVAHLYARRFKMPMIIFIVAGIIPLVPGGMAYNAMRNVVEDDYLQGLQYGLKAFLITGAIVMGLVFAEVLMQFVFRAIRSSKSKLQRTNRK
ncbi:threonine/serine exporter family protein [Lysinibacillus sphaericus]|uniref:threonine/serine exporter family protein n=1 Tax=Lysinibacillus sphaericus TaxID=1421 RepID=UPI001E38B54A|nr:threonine/serine exporter family protein [Lysinibacillus sphaericus]MCS1381157.1 threonine/serine exporter family protein [Lysinibacillus sphaericus]UDK95222.1 threonine/serine exporter family protein [Lysinibacillus sphaericus]